MRRLPKFIRVGGLKVALLRVPDLMHDADDGSHAHRAYGVFDPAQPLIWLDTASGPERQKVTLVHEFLHAAINTARLDFDAETEEMMVGRLAPFVLDFLRSNRGAVAYLQES